MSVSTRSIRISDNPNGLGIIRTAAVTMAPSFTRYMVRIEGISAVGKRISFGAEGDDPQEVRNRISTCPHLFNLGGGPQSADSLLSPLIDKLATPIGTSR